MIALKNLKIENLRFRLNSGHKLVSTCLHACSLYVPSVCRYLGFEIIEFVLVGIFHTSSYGVFGLVFELFF